MPAKVALSDLDKDGDLDVIVAYNSGIAWLENYSGSFEGSTRIGGGQNTQTVAVGDFNRDGNPDVASCSYTTGHIVVDTNPAPAVDSDNDGYPVGQDCNDGDPSVHPGAREICGDGIDNDCDGSSVRDELDVDNDGVPVCAGDCDDTNPDVRPGADESCNGVDDNCDGEADEGLLDTDEDGVCDEIDLCTGDDDAGDADRDGTWSQVYRHYAEGRLVHEWRLFENE